LRQPGGVTLRQYVRDASAAAAHRIWGWMRWAGAVGPQDRLGRRFAAFGDGSILVFPPGDLVGEEHIAIGAGTMVGAHVSLSVGMASGQPLAPGAQSPVLRIGDRCSIGRASHVVAHRRVVIGDDVITGPSCYVTDQNHVYADPEVPIARQWPADDPVEIGAGSWIGAGAVILPGTRLGRNTVVGAGSVVRGSFADHAVLAGVPARLVRRYEPGRGWDPSLPELDLEPPPDWPVDTG
jgi:carbonic anhydrase/acetyltransferase-like protein (isoleucine patch superfamily)